MHTPGLQLASQLDIFAKPWQVSMGDPLDKGSFVVHKKSSRTPATRTIKNMPSCKKVDTYEIRTHAPEGNA